VFFVSFVVENLIALRKTEDHCGDKQLHHDSDDVAFSMTILQTSRAT
jgi:hypothetical protein